MKIIIFYIAFAFSLIGCGGGSSSSAATENSTDHSPSVIDQMIRNASAAVTSTVNVNNSNP
jgi:hypothetical protein